MMSESEFQMGSFFSSVQSQNTGPGNCSFRKSNSTSTSRQHAAFLAWRMLLQAGAERKTARHGPWAKGGTNMLGYAVTFLIIAVIAAVLGFGGIAGAAAGIAKIL